MQLAHTALQGLRLSLLPAEIPQPFLARAGCILLGMELTQEILDKVYEIVKTHPQPVVHDSFERCGLPGTVVNAALKELQRQGGIMEWPLFALPPTK